MFEVIIWGIFLILIFIGFAGILLPGIPGLFLFFLASVMIYYAIPGILSSWTILIMLLGFLLTFPLDLLGTIIGAKWGRATKWGLIGATLGGFIGMFFGIPGLVIGPLLGAFFAELLLKKRSVNESMQAGIGAGMGLAVSTAAKALLALLLVIAFVLDIFFIS
jgi:uncharacterized protein YqgC (DUF456 family)